jgi:hypothetical protein
MFDDVDDGLTIFCTGGISDTIHCFECLDGLWGFAYHIRNLCVLDQGKDRLPFFFGLLSPPISQGIVYGPFRNR